MFLTGSRVSGGRWMLFLRHIHKNKLRKCSNSKVATGRPSFFVAGRNGMGFDSPITLLDSGMGPGCGVVSGAPQRSGNLMDPAPPRKGKMVYEGARARRGPWLMFEDAPPNLL